MSLFGSGITRVTEATFFSASASMILAMCRAAAESIDSSQRKSARTRNLGSTSCNSSRIRCATIFASSAVTVCAALITSRRFDRSSSTAYILGNHTNQAWSQVCHCALRNAAAVVRLRRYGVSRRRPLQRLLEEPFCDSGLKRARLGLADSKSRTDFELRRTISFDVDSAALLERRPDRA